MTGRYLAYVHYMVLRSARSFGGEQFGDLVGVGWLSALSRGDVSRVHAAQARFVASEQNQR